jgi:hypothetical protein
MLRSLRKIALLAFAALLVLPAGASAFYVSKVQRLSPSVQGLSLSVLGRDEQLRLQNRTGKTVIVEGYDQDAYLRFSPDGTVEENTRSSATYLNVDRYSAQEVPASARPDAKPRWKKIRSDGSYAWFDHRIHFTNKRVPKELRGKTTITRVLGWKVPIIVGAQRTVARGALFWDPSKPGSKDSDDSDGFPAWAFVALAAGVLLLGALAYLLGRRRGRSPGGADEPRQEREAW